MPSRDAAGRWLPPTLTAYRFSRALPSCIALPESTVAVRCFLQPVTLIASVASLFDPSRDAVLGSIYLKLGQCQLWGLAQCHGAEAEGLAARQEQG